jgi:hypothetical protein
MAPVQEWAWEDDFGRFRVRLEGTTLTFESAPNGRGVHEMGVPEGTSRRTLDSLEGMVPTWTLAEIRAAMEKALK